MTALEIKNYLADLVSHLTFNFNNKDCGIDPLAKDNYEMWCGDNIMTAKSIDEVMNTLFFDGKSLNDIANMIELD